MKQVRLVALLGMLAAGSALAADPIRIGISIAQSPPGSVVQGAQVRDGAEIVKDMINAKGGVLGRQVELVFEDNQGIPEKGRAAAEKLITKDKVVAITGGHQSSVCLAEIEVAHRYKMPYINTNCWSDDIRKKGYAEVFNPGNYNTRVSTAMAETIAAMGVKRVVAFAENTDYGIGQAKLMAELIKAKAPSVDFKYETLDRAGKDFTPAVLVMRSNPPDMVVNIMLPPAAYILMNQMYEQGVAPSAENLALRRRRHRRLSRLLAEREGCGQEPGVLRSLSPENDDSATGPGSHRRIQETHQERTESSDLPGGRLPAPDRRRDPQGQQRRAGSNDQGVAGHQVRRCARRVPVLQGAWISPSSNGPRSPT